MNKVLEKVYGNMINTLLKDFTLEEQEEVIFAYQEYIINCYSNSLNLSDDEERIINYFTYLEQIKWKDADKESKQSLLLKDEYLNKMGYLSNIAHENALARFYGKKVNITKEKAEEYIELMKKYQEKIRKFNKAIGLSYLSEGILDFNYALGLSDNISLRISRLY